MCPERKRDMDRVHIYEEEWRECTYTEMKKKKKTGHENHRDVCLKKITSVLATSLIKAKLMCALIPLQYIQARGQKPETQMRKQFSFFYRTSIAFLSVWTRGKNSAIRLIWFHVVRAVARAGKNAVNWMNPCGEPFLYASSSSFFFSRAVAGQPVWRRHIWRGHYTPRREIR